MNIILKNELQAVNNIFNNFNKYNITMTCIEYKALMKLLHKRIGAKAFVT